MPPAYDDAGLGSLPFAAAWIVLLFAFGVAVWGALNRARPRPVPLSLCMAIGCAAAVPLLAAASAVGNVFAGVGAIGIAAAALGLAFRRTLRRGRNLCRIGKAEGAMLLLAAAGAAIMLPTVVRPELSYDVLSYHLPVARHLRTSFGYIEGNYYSRLPSAAFLLYAPVVPSGDRTLEAPGVRLLIWCSLVAGAGLCARVAGQLGARRAPGAAAAALYAWHPMAVSSLLNSNSDLLTAMFALAAFERALSALRSRSATSWIVAGFLAATAVGTKFSALGIVALPMLAGSIVGLAGRGAAMKAIGRACVLLMAGIAAGYAPWMIRSAAIAGNPLHPFAGEAEGWSRVQNDFLVEQHRPQSPLSAAYWRDALGKADVLGYGLAVVPPDPETGEGGVRISAILLVVLASLARGRHAGTRFALVAVAGGCAAWLTVGLAPARFVLPGVGLALALAVATVSGAPFFGLRVGGGALLGLAFAFAAFGQARGGTLGMPWSAEAWQRGSLLPENVHAAALDSEAKGRLLVLFEARGRWFPEGALLNTVWDVPPWADDLRASSDARDFAARLRDRGIDRVFANEFEWGRLVNFYGGLEPRPAMGTVGTAEPRGDLLAHLGAYPPFRHAEFDEGHLRTLAEFLVLARDGATQLAPAGPVSAIWLAPVPQATRRTEPPPP